LLRGGRAPAPAAAFFTGSREFRRRDADPLGHARPGAPQLAAVLADPVGDVVVMAHEKENEQHQHHATPRMTATFIA